MLMEQNRTISNSNEMKFVLFVVKRECVCMYKLYMKSDEDIIIIIIRCKSSSISFLFYRCAYYYFFFLNKGGKKGFLYFFKQKWLENSRKNFLLFT